MNSELKNYSLLLIKPDAVKRNLESKIIDILHHNNFKIIKRKEFFIRKQDVMILYYESKQQKHFNLLVDYFNEGNVIAFKLEKENCVEALNNLVGKTDPKKSGKGTLRNMFGLDILQNSFHSSNENRVDIELDLIFNK